jgi:hypothetical protein
VPFTNPSTASTVPSVASEKRVALALVGRQCEAQLVGDRQGVVPPPSVGHRFGVAEPLWLLVGVYRVRCPQQLDRPRGIAQRDCRRAKEIPRVGGRAVAVVPPVQVVEQALENPARDVVHAPKVVPQARPGSSPKPGPSRKIGDTSTAIHGRAGTTGDTRGTRADSADDEAPDPGDVTTV